MIVKMAAPPAANRVQVKEHLYKILVIGEFGVGKTSIIRRYTEDFFSDNYKLTIGVDFALKNLDWDETTKINLQLWDIAGHERFGHMTRVYYKYAIAAIIVFDLTRPATFQSVTKWLNDVNSKVMLANEEPVPVMLLANKCDQEEKIDSNGLTDFCKDYGLIGWFPTSAKSNINIDEAMKFLIEKILSLPTGSQSPTEHISLPTETDRTFHYDESFQREEVPEKQSACCNS